MNGTVARSPLARWLWMTLGFVCVGLGAVGVVVPGLPTTVFFVAAAACFSRSSPRFERWVLTRPGVGPLVRDYRAGLGMPRRAKAIAIASIVLMCSLSAFLAVDHPVGRVAIVGLGAVGVAWILWRVPTRGTVTGPARRTEPEVRVFRVTALAEAATWCGLLVGMFVEHVLDGSDQGVAVFGRIHGVVVLFYVAAVLVVSRRQRWGPDTTITGLLASVPPFGSIVFERWATRTGRLLTIAPAAPRANCPSQTTVTD